MVLSLVIIFLQCNALVLQGKNISESDEYEFSSKMSELFDEMRDDFTQVLFPEGVIKITR